MSHRAKALARIADPTLPRKVHRADNTVTDAFLHSKRDKQLIRKASFRARVADKVSDRGGVKKLKRRRPSKKLVATLESLADALPDVPETAGAGDGQEGDREGGGKRRRQQSLRTRPGSLKRKEKLVQAEMARFGLNLAQLTAVKEETVAAADETTMVVEDSKVDDDAATAAPTAASTTTAATTATPPAPPATKQSTANRFALLRSYITMTMEQSPAFAKPE